MEAGFLTTPHPPEILVSPLLLASGIVSWFVQQFLGTENSSVKVSLCAAQTPPACQDPWGSSLFLVSRPALLEAPTAER